MGLSTWGPIDQIQGAGHTGDCTPDATDSFVIPDGADVLVRGNLLFDPAVVGSGLVVRAGGTLAAWASQQPLRIAVGSEGLVCESGSACRFSNRYRGHGAEAAHRVETPDTRWHFRVGEVVPCAGDCAATPELVALRSDSDVDRRSIEPIQPGEVLCFFDPDESDAWVSPDSGYCYEIVRTKTDAAPYEIVFDVRQGSSDPAGWPLARREIKLATLAAPISRGDRYVALAASAAIGADGEHVARWLRFGIPGTGSFEDIAYKIQESFDGDLDSVVIGDLRGARGDHATGAPVAIDYGWRRGDAFFVSVPVVVSSATPSRFDSPFLVNGAYYARGLVLDRMWVPTIGADATIQKHTDVWVRDATSSGTGVSLQLANRHNEVLHRTSITGGIEGTDCAPHGDPPSTACDTMHGMQVSCSSGLVIDGYNARHLGDDNFVLDAQLCANGSTEVVARHWHCSFMGGNGRSASFIDPAGYALENASFTDLVVDDCVSPDSAAFSSVGRQDAPPIDVGNVVLWGLRGGGGGGDFDAHAYQMRELTALGVEPHAPNIAIMPNHVENFAVRESRSLTADDNSVVAVGTLKLRRGFVRDIELAQSNFHAVRAVDGSEIEDVAILNVTTRGSCAGGCALVAPYGSAPYTSWKLSHALLGDSALPGHTQSGVTFPWPDPGPGMALGSLWFTGLGTQQTALAAFPAQPGFSGPGAPTFDGPLCFSSNGLDVPPHFTPTGAPELIRDLDPAFAGGIGGSIALPAREPDFPCGFRGAIGLTQQNWALSKSGLLPESIGGDPWIDGPCSNGFDDDGDGRTDHPDDLGCLTPHDASEQATFACDNGLDDDGDGLVDYAADCGCSARDAASEDAACQTTLRCGLGAEIVVALALLYAARRRGIRGRQRLS